MSVNQKTIKSALSTSESANKKRKSVSIEIKEESFIIGCAIKVGIHLLLERKTKKSESLQKFNIIDISVPKEALLDENINKELQKLFMVQQEKKEGLVQRDLDKSKQNSIYNFLLEVLSNYGNQINYMKTRGSSNTVKRERISTFNGLNQKEIYEIGEKVNEYLIKEIPIEEGKKKKECRKLIKEIDLNISLPLYTVNACCSESHYGNEQLNYLEQTPIVQTPVLCYYDGNNLYLPNGVSLNLPNTNYVYVPNTNYVCVPNDNYVYVPNGSDYMGYVSINSTDSNIPEQSNYISVNQLSTKLE
ncbi:hypothetical protein EHI_031340 [Entamoeba histolytica HM-1:IMSS]|uniref:Uncharacterized protein n=1 Tax=Entamoeba histolytica (strain ATCC 30459 / HM-1:IMSS / ABRM) TaxID=294381 RepID=C4M4M3_ENTH1|nr:hypothetical protein EHI_031340 [Entamoeba histolytica HM-1:IMSS]EAL48706.1 hypothetical protein EHI_031340 [Entamoeba histolytica HM-1:IMSS]|eukprot:XP_654092.1 hypothetical protein EHI_031340 [Entamoeba histolytica HM-1:IMSS]